MRDDQAGVLYGALKGGVDGYHLSSVVGTHAWLQRLHTIDRSMTTGYKLNVTIESQ